MFLGKLQANKPTATSRNPTKSVMMVLFFIITFQSVIKPAIKTKKRAMEFPTQVNR